MGRRHVAIPGVWGQFVPLRFISKTRQRRVINPAKPMLRRAMEEGSGTVEDAVWSVISKLSMPLVVVNGATMGLFPERNPNSMGPPVEEKFGIAGPGPGRVKGPS